MRELFAKLAVLRWAGYPARGEERPTKLRIPPSFLITWSGWDKLSPISNATHGRETRTHNPHAGTVANDSTSQMACRY